MVFINYSHLRKIAAVVFLLTAFSFLCRAQFQKEAFSQNYGAEEGASADSTESMFSFKEYFGGLKHKNELKIGSMTAGSAIFIGGSQIYLRQYWKLPIIYGSIAGLGGYGYYRYHQYSTSQKAYDDFLTQKAAYLAENPQGVFSQTEPEIDDKSKRIGTDFLIGAGVAYWGTLMDGVINYQRDVYPHPGRATLYSVFMPGLGQAYNGEYWKMPIYYGCLIGAYHFYSSNNLNYQRFRNIYKEATDTQVAYSGPISSETAKYYRDVYRRYRDYSIVALLAFYLLQVIDANIFAYMYDFDVSDDLVSLSFNPTVIPQNCYASNSRNAYGMGLSLSF